MGARGDSVLFRAAAVALCFALVLGGTATADSLTPAEERGGAGEEIGRAGFAYLTGVRTFAAAVLWNRIEPVFHGYYEDLPLAEQTFILPTVHTVILLDPELEFPYYVAAWMLAQRGDVAEGVELARLGVENNPRSGLLHASYAQILFLAAQDLDAAVEQSRRGLGEEMVWLDLIQQRDGYVVFRDVLRAAGHEAEADRAAAEVRRIDEEVDRLGVEVDTPEQRP